MNTIAARPSATSPPGYSEILACRPESARGARLLVTTALHMWGFSSFTAAGTLIVSELIANVVPTMASPSGDAGSGLDLLLVDAMSDRWGCRPHSSSKVAWAELSIKADQTEK
ncbi:hypothetical protein ACFWRV_09995 [Streptomyces sp. NPDC058576]|uniref:hypothetical protein n=1 Tax=Streptomyces sp. NPDC058576 TaxID=3346547 RepID=UPI0036659BBE